MIPVIDFWQEYHRSDADFFSMHRIWRQMVNPIKFDSLLKVVSFVFLLGKFTLQTIVTNKYLVDK